jgi:hypothetical protein
MSYQKSVDRVRSAKDRFIIRIRIRAKSGSGLRLELGLWLGNKTEGS